MWDSLVIIHRKGGLPLEFHSNEPWVHWKTCLRQIFFGLEHWKKPNLNPTDEQYEGIRAYQFLLEVVSGLHSKVIGETEVLGQFRELFLNPDQFGNSGWGEFLSKLTQSVLADVKVVRQKHLTAMGSQSYGSFTRKMVKPYNQVHVIGSGNLAEAILPWLYKETHRVSLHARNLEKAQRFIGEFPLLQISKLDENMKIRGAVVIAAPLSSEETQALLSNSSHEIDLIVDLRETCLTDPISLAVPVSTLEDFFKESQATQAQIVSKVQAAQQTITELCQRRSQQAQVQIRPFGWEDLCG